MPTVPKLLFVSPVFPDITGYGLAMRAGAILEGLSASCQVYLLIIPIHDPYRAALSPRVRPWCRQYCVIRASKLRNRMVRLGGMLQRMSTQPSRPSEWRYASGRMIYKAAQAFQDIRFDYLHVFRLYMTPYAMPYLHTQKHLTACYLDLDDVESSTRRRLADLYRANGLYTQARREQQAADMYVGLERELLPRFDGIYVCSRQDKNQLNTQVSGQNVFVLPNVIRLPSGSRPAKSGGPFTFLFVGNLAYYPNEDAVAYFLEHVLPCLRQRAKRPFCLTVIGSGQSRRLRHYRQIPEYRYLGCVSELAPYYDQADAVVVPLRAGGGTRIKVLEAFSFKRPVVSTTLGVEGLEVDHEKHILIADRPQHFAEQCCRLMEDKQLSATLTANAFVCLVAHYTQEAMQRTLSRIMLGNSPGAARA
jgi:glycosyltransferase involved in cell wall biosynthesis